MSQRFLESLAARRNGLSPSEQLVADFVLQHPQRVLRMPIAALAAESGVSEPTVLRFVRALGLSGYPELKLLTGQSLVSGTPYLHAEVQDGDGLDTIIAKIFDSSVYVLNMVRESLDRAAVGAAVEALATARRIECLGSGAASTLAHDAQQKFTRLGIPAIIYPDTHLQRMAAAMLKPGDVALCFSYTGAVRDTYKMAEAARLAGATVIAVTKPETPLAVAADIVLGVETREDTEIYTPMTSRIAHDVVIDVLATALVLRLGAGMVDRLQQAKDSVADLRMPHDDTRRRRRRKPEAGGEGAP